MVQTIGPMVHGAPGRGRGIESAHVVGGVLGGAVTGLVAGALGAGLRLLAGTPAARPALLAVTGVAVGALLRDLLGRAGSIGSHRQTPRSWRYLLPPSVTAFLNGADLGLGWTTRIYFASFVAAVAAAFVAADPLLGALIGGAFGASRAATAVALTHSAHGGSATMEELIHRRPLVKAANATAVGLFALAAVASAVGGVWPWG